MTPWRFMVVQDRSFAPKCSIIFSSISERMLNYMPKLIKACCVVFDV